MTGNEIAVRVIAAIGVAVVVAALIYALSSGHVFVLPFLLILGFPMGRLLGKSFMPRRDDSGSGDHRDPPDPPRMSLN